MGNCCASYEIQYPEYFNFVKVNSTNLKEYNRLMRVISQNPKRMTSKDKRDLLHQMYELSDNGCARAYMYFWELAIFKKAEQVDQFILYKDLVPYVTEPVVRYILKKERKNLRKKELANSLQISQAILTKFIDGKSSERVIDNFKLYWRSIYNSANYT